VRKNEGKKKEGKPASLKNIADKGFNVCNYLAPLYVRCQLSRRTHSERVRMAGHSDSNFDRSLSKAPPPIHIRSGHLDGAARNRELLFIWRAIESSVPMNF